MEELPMPKFTVPEATILSNQSPKHLYKLIREGRLKASKDVAGQLRIGYGELSSFVRNVASSK